ncbi:1-acyl-sn-glycerol-3-phosphate acyltransferase [Planktotalea sp.]|uniref:1-acyl-sn-glycerol-3-phosphate acyltransferase n=1 Tax=Planktotalea sp. TaxID=2029877 RepID=UPI003298BD63
MTEPEHIDRLLHERAPWLFQETAPVAFLRKSLQSALSYEQTLLIADRLKPLSAVQIMDRLAIHLCRNLSVSGIEHIPMSGPALIVCNHPTGIADAIMLWSALRKRRSDTYFFANRDIERVLPQMRDMIAPVEWRAEKRSHSATRRMLKFTAEATREERLGVIFPSGRLAYREGLSLRERPWMGSAVTLARKFDLPIVPVHLKGRNSALFYLLSMIHPSLRDITLFHETLNKARAPFEVHAKAPIAVNYLPQDNEAAIAQLRALCFDQDTAPKSRASKPIVSRPPHRGAALGVQS